MVREEAPNGVRTRFCEVVASLRDFNDQELRNLVCRVTDVPPDFGSLLYFDIWPEAQRIIYACEWFHFYEIVEEVSQLFRRKDGVGTALVRIAQQGEILAKAMNEILANRGIGWQLVEGCIVFRGDIGFERTIASAVEALTKAGRPTAAEHVTSAIHALSERPKADTPGAVAHATSALECVLGEITGEALTLGKYLDRHSRLLHPALKKALDGIYGYASDAGARHGKEGIEPSLEEAQFAVSTCSAACTLLTNRPPQP